MNVATDARRDVSPALPETSDLWNGRTGTGLAMERTRRRGVASGCAWVVGLAALTWFGMGLSGVQGRQGGWAVAQAADALDVTPPVAVRVTTLPNENGWYRTPTAYAWVGEDPESGIAWCQSGSVVEAVTATARFVYGTCTNGAGTSAPVTGFSYRYDDTPPSLHPVVAPTVVPRHGTVLARAGASDALSGIERAVCNGGRRLGTRSLGRHTVTCVARDRADNVATVRVTYRVVDSAVAARAGR